MLSTLLTCLIPYMPVLLVSCLLNYLITNLLKCLYLPGVGGGGRYLTIRLSPPSLAGVGAGADLGKKKSKLIYDLCRVLKIRVPTKRFKSWPS